MKISNNSELRLLEIFILFCISFYFYLYCILLGCLVIDQLTELSADWMNSFFWIQTSIINVTEK